MRYPKFLVINVLLASVIAVGCARTHRDTTGFATVDSTTVNAGFVQTWQVAKSVLREMDYDLYTRDKRGSLVAYSKMKRRFRVATPHRTRIVVTIEEVSPDRTKVSVETVGQVYGVSPLTYPDWHDRQATDNAAAVAILDAVKARTG